VNIRPPPAVLLGKSSTESFGAFAHRGGSGSGSRFGAAQNPFRRSPLSFALSVHVAEGCASAHAGGLVLRRGQVSQPRRPAHPRVDAAPAPPPLTSLSKIRLIKSICTVMQNVRAERAQGSLTPICQKGHVRACIFSPILYHIVPDRSRAAELTHFLHTVLS
jgi:hypothetical protein